MQEPNETTSESKRTRGLTSHLSGAAAEDTVAKLYENAGWTLLERRWRGQAGEIDLIVGREGVTAFVEVKQSATIDAAISSLRPRQLARISAAAEEYFLNDERPSSGEMRLDLAAVDRSGCIEIIENLTLW
jgi:putative endonuclease